MKAIRLHNYGLSEELKYENAPVPEISDEQILVKVMATSVNPLDMKKASGIVKDKTPLHFPWIPGHDFSGIIENAGKNVSNFKVGDEVYGNCNGGSYAEFLALDTFAVDIKPEALTFEEAASVPHVGETAWQAIHTHGKLTKDQKVLIHGAAGAVGAYAVQFASMIGATIYTTAASTEKEFLLSLGAEKVIDYQTEDFTQLVNDLDLVLVLVGGDIQKRSYTVLKEGGRLVSTTGPIMEEEARQKNITAISMIIHQSGDDLRKISKLINEHQLKTDVALVYNLEHAADGWRILSGEDPSLPKISHGKIVLKISPDNYDSVEEKKNQNPSNV